MWDTCRRYIMQDKTISGTAMSASRYAYVQNFGLDAIATSVNGACGRKTTPQHNTPQHTTGAAYTSPLHYHFNNRHVYTRPGEHGGNNRSSQPQRRCQLEARGARGEGRGRYLG